MDNRLFISAGQWAVITARAVLALGFSGAASANRLVNTGFETGDFFGWDAFVGGGVLLTGQPSPFFPSLSKGVATDGTVVDGADPLFQPTFVNVRSGGFAGYALVKQDIPGPNGWATGVDGVRLGQNISGIAPDTT